MNTVYEILSARLIEAIELEQKLPWEKPWTLKGGVSNPSNAITKKPYRGINWLQTIMTPFNNPYWITFKQGQEKKISLRKGEKGTPIAFWKPMDKIEFIDGKEVKRKTFILRYYTVFNLAQFDGWEKAFPSIAEELSKDIPEASFNLDERAEKVIQNYKEPSIQFGGNGAYYSVINDLVNMPNMEYFKEKELYYATFFHELSHSTGHKNRLNRKGITEMDSSFGSKLYSFEELVAEISGAMLNSHVGIANKRSEDNSVAYLQSWIKSFKNDPTVLPKAAQCAQKAFDYILGIYFGESEPISEIDTE